MYTFKQSNNARVHNLINLYFVILNEKEIWKDQKAQSDGPSLLILYCMYVVILRWFYFHEFR